MKVGAVFPNNAVGNDPGAIKAFAQAIEDMGFNYLTLYDHVFGASAAHYDRATLDGPYRETDTFNEPLVTFGYLAAVTSKLHFTTGVLILAQRQTVLVAKQAAQLDVLSGGRLRVGIGTGWNYTEYEALGLDWKTRGERVEEQIKVLRDLWTKPIVDFRGKFHSIPHGGINPLPAQRPIPIFLGGASEPVLRRVATLADGWMPVFKGLELASRGSQKVIDPHAAVARMHDYARAAGRDPATIQMDCRVTFEGRTEEGWRQLSETYRALGATHITLVTAQDPNKDTDAHLAALKRMKEAIA